MKQANFLSWFEKFVPASHLLSTGPVVLFVDDHNSEGSLDLISSARSHGIDLFYFPSHTTAVLPPLDLWPSQNTVEEDLEKALQTHDWNVDFTVFQSLIGQVCRTYFFTSSNSTTSLFSYSKKWLHKLQETSV